MLDLLTPDYDPLAGVDCYGERFELKVKEGSFLYLPEEMIAEKIIYDIQQAGSVLKYLEDKNDYSEDKMIMLMFDIGILRIKYDFEFWAISCVKIIDKESREPIPFRLRVAQRKALSKLEDMRKAGKPIRMILLKARQWGGSTLVQLYMAWIQLFHKRNWNSAIVADVDDQARNIRAMYTNMATEHPELIQKITFSPYEGSSKNRIIEERGCVVGIGSAQKPDNLRSYDFSMVHLSEAGIWKSTPAKSAEDLATSLRAGILKRGYTLIVLESTAKGVGNFFHREWTAAVEKRSGYLPLFVAWFEIDLYLIPIDDYESFIDTMGEKEWKHWELGATLEGINWYRTYKADENYDDWRMESEYPSTPEEAFQSTGRRAFRPSYVLAARSGCMPPEYVGELFGDSDKGPEALKNIRFEKTPKGNLWVWAKPDHSIKIANRYCIFGDIGGRTEGADYSALKVLDRYWFLAGGVPEVVAVWWGHLDQDLFAWKAAQLGTWYDMALTAIESNSLRKEKASSGGDHYLTVLNEIADHYDNLYMRTDPEKVRQGAPVQYGFHTNSKTKPMLVDTLNGCLRDEGYIERDHRACDEMDMYEIKDDGTYGAVEGQHDDHVIISAGANWLSDFMDMPVEIKERTVKGSRKLRSEAQF